MVVFLCEFSASFAYLAVKEESYRKGAKNAKEPLDTVYGIDERATDNAVKKYWSISI